MIHLSIYHVLQDDLFKTFSASFIDNPLASFSAWIRSRMFIWPPLLIVWICVGDDWDCCKDSPVEELMSINSLILKETIDCYRVIADLDALPSSRAGVQGEQDNYIWVSKIWVLDLVFRVCDCTGAPIGILRRFEPGRTVGVDPFRGTLACFGSSGNH